MRLTSFALWLALAIVLSGCAPPEARQEAPPAERSETPARPSVVLVTIDTLRGDRLGAFGHPVPTSPHLDRFADRAVVYANAFSTSSFTPPSHASLLTSRYVSRHGLKTWNALDESIVTVAEVLRDAGYRTGASVNLNLLTSQNLGQGFDWAREELRDGRTIVEDALEFLAVPSSDPFFLWLHLYDVHRPYGGSPALFGRDRRWIRRYAEGTGTFGDDSKADYRLSPDAIETRNLTEEDLDYVVDRYDAGIAYLDRALAPLLRELSEPDRFASTLVVITSDHGENLLENRSSVFTHDPFLHDEVTRIPLMIRFPGGRHGGRSERSLVSLIDVAPTALAATGVATPPEFEGENLAALLDGAPLERGAIFMECWGDYVLRAVRTHDDRLVIQDRKKRKTEFWNLDGGIAMESPKPLSERDKALRELLRAFEPDRAKDTELPDLDPETIEKLRSLGYLD